jgi:hypothetical protein
MKSETLATCSGAKKSKAVVGIELRVTVQIELQVVRIAAKRIVSIAGFAH